VTAPLEALDAALSRALDADAAREAAEVACEHPDCVAPARWRWLNRPCAHRWTLCPEHLSESLDRFAASRTTGGKCADCRVTTDDIEIGRL